MDTQHETVLIMDDDFHFVAKTADALRAEELHVLCAQDGDVGLAMAEVRRPGLIIMELVMPRRSGFLVLERLRQTDITCPIIIVTKNGGTRHRTYAELLGFDDYFVKPAETDLIVDSVLDHLGLLFDDAHSDELESEPLKSVR